MGSPAVIVCKGCGVKHSAKKMLPLYRKDKVTGEEKIVGYVCQRKLLKKARRINAGK